MSRSSSYSEGGSRTSTATTPSITPEILSPSEVHGDHADQRLDNDTLKLKVELLAMQVDRNTRNIQGMHSDLMHLNTKIDDQGRKFDEQERKLDERFNQTNQNLRQLESLILRLLSKPESTRNEINTIETPIENAEMSVPVPENSYPVQRDARNHAPATFEIPTCSTSGQPLTSAWQPETGVVNRPVDHNVNKLFENVGFSKPNTYDGNTDWTDYRVHFETVSKINQWSEKVKALKLISCMQGAALAILGDIDVSNPPSYVELTKILTNRFAPENQADMFRSQIDARVRRKGESLPELAQDIKRLIRLAYPTVTQEVRDSLTYRAFRDSLNDYELEWALCQANKDNIDEALHIALRYEAFQMGKKKPFARFKTKEHDGQSGNKRCFKCGDSGHLRNHCPTRDDPLYHGQ